MQFCGIAILIIFLGLPAAVGRECGEITFIFLPTSSESPKMAAVRVGSGQKVKGGTTSFDGGRNTNTIAIAGLSLVFV